MRHFSKFWLVILCLSVFSIAATWPWDSYSAKENTSSAPEGENKAPAMASSRNNVSPAVKDSASTENAIQLSRTVSVPPVLKTTSAASRYKNPALESGADVKSIQQNVEQLITLNENLKKLHAENASQIKGMIDQARVHQKLLDVDNVSAVKLPAKVKVGDLNKVLMQEKIRQVRDQAKQNIQDVKDVREFQTALEEEKQKAASEKSR